ncbi:Zinc finger, PHD-type domain containing protein [Melia azedarach]|uniref:Zinc finger, PHD-type domain containing protein n=1 Tax=Melia azedarach TaxID=155640 RepID=A0ACC1XMR0_MELAZ|nr:Zinc finger, PHD-type domain containing protein [Melia azedarach]
MVKSYSVEERKKMNYFIRSIRSQLTTISLPWVAEDDVEVEAVNVRDYTIVPKLVPILKYLLDKHGDISGDCTLTQNLKTYPLFFFCSTVESMSSTKVMDITNKLMLTWWCTLKFVRETGFKIDFVFDHLKRIVHSRYGTDNDNYKSSQLYKLHGDIAQLSQEIDELTEEINIRRKKVGELKKKTQNIISSTRSERSRLEAKACQNLWNLGGRMRPQDCCSDISRFFLGFIICFAIS